jgi:hypothetical protein
MIRNFCLGGSPLLKPTSLVLPLVLGWGTYIVGLLIMPR